MSGLVLKYRNGEWFVIQRGYETALPASSRFRLTKPSHGMQVDPYQKALRKPSMAAVSF